MVGWNTNVYDASGLLTDHRISGESITASGDATLSVVVSSGAFGLPTGVADADFAYRIAQPSVVFYHDFRADAEVDQFREDGTLVYNPNDTLDPPTGGQVGTVSRITSDGITGGGCLEIYHNAGSRDAQNWYRPMSALSSPGNGRTTDDPAAGGTVPLDAGGTWGPPTRTPDWQSGNYGPTSTGNWDGNNFFVQYALKVSSSRLTGGVFGGKVQYLTRMDRSLTAQELVTSYDYTPSDWRIYKGGTGTLTGNIGNPQHYFDEWVTYLVHVVPGDEVDGAGPDQGGSNTRLNVYQKRANDYHYTHIYQRNDLAVDYNDAYLQAWNAVIFSGYFNGFSFPEAFYQRYDQVIFSREWIPPPRTYSNTALEASADSISTPGQWTLDPIAWNPGSTQWDISWQNRTAFYDDNRGEIQYMGKTQASVSTSRSPHFIYNERTNSWTTTSTSVTPSSFGHIWNCTFDHTENPGDYYHVSQNPSDNGGTRHIKRFDREAGTWGTTSDASFDVWNTSSTPNPGMCFSPNLLGPGRPGIYCFGDRLCYYDIINDDWTSVVTDAVYLSQHSRQNTTLYVPGLGMIVFGSGEDPAGGFIIEDGNADATSLTNIYMPFQVHNTSPGNSAHMLLDPTDPTKSTIMLLERGGDRVWTCSDPLAGAGAWTLESWGHPFWDSNPYHGQDSQEVGSWTCCSIPRYGVVMALASNQSGGGTMLWRPGGTLSEV